MTTPLAKPLEEAAEKRSDGIALLRIMVPLDFSDHSKKALRYALRFAEQFGAELEVVHVVTPIIFADGMIPPVEMEDLSRETEKHARSELEKIATADGTEHVTVKATVLQGEPYDEIVNHAAESQTDLLLIATHGRTGLQHFLLGSNAEKILRHAPCPVMVVRDKEHEFV